MDTVFQIGSDSKQFTAAAILQLRDQGKLSLDDDITKWLPDFETRGNRATLRHDGTRLRYSMGLFVGEDSHGIKFIGHDGGGFGFSSQTRWYPDARMAVVVLTNSEPDDTTAVADNLAAAVLTPPPIGPFTGDASLLAGTYKGPGRGREMVIDVTQTPQGIAFTIDGAAARPLPWVEAWTFRQGQALLTFHRNASGGPATELRFDRGGGHFILKRQ